MKMRTNDCAEEQLRSALFLLTEPAVNEFLLAPNALTDLTILTSRFQRTASFPYALHRVVWGVPALASQAHSSWLCTPAFSIGHVTVGVVVQRLRFEASPQLMATRPSGHTMLRFAVDAENGVLLTVSAESPMGTFDIQYTAFHSMGVRTSLNAVVRAQALRHAIDNGFDTIFLRRALVFSFAHEERRGCAICGATCTCAPSFPVPAHPLDFSVFPSCMARALGNYSGSGEQQLAVHRGSSPLCVTNISVRLAVRHLDSPTAVDRLWKWAVQTRYALLPAFPTRVQMPTAIKEPFAKRCIVEELDALRDEEERCNSSAGSAASVASAEISCNGISKGGIQYPSISPEDLVVAPPAEIQSLQHPTACQTELSASLQSQLPQVQPVFSSASYTDSALPVEAVTPPRPQPISTRQMLPPHSQPQTEIYQSVSVKPRTHVPNVVTQSEPDVTQSRVQQTPPPYGLTPPQELSPSQSLPIPQPSPQKLPHQIIEKYCLPTRPEPESFMISAPPSLSSTSQTSNLPDTSQACRSLLSVPSPLANGEPRSSLLPTPQPFGVGIAQPNSAMVMVRHDPGEPPSGALPSAGNNSGADQTVDGGAGPINLPIHAVPSAPAEAMPARVKATPVTKPHRQRVAARIEKNPYAPPVQETTYVGERDRKLMDRKERNRKSAARSNLRRKLARQALERNLSEANSKLETLKQRQEELKAENELLKRSLAREEPDPSILSEGAAL